MKFNSYIVAFMIGAIFNKSFVGNGFHININLFQYILFIKSKYLSHSRVCAIKFFVQETSKERLLVCCQVEFNPSKTIFDYQDS